MHHSIRYLINLVEAFDYTKLISQYGNQLVRKYAVDVKKQLSADEIISSVIKYDPTPNKIYSQWLVRMYAIDGIKKFEDIPSKAIDALKKFTKLKNMKIIPVELRDIFKFTSLDELMDIIDQYSSDITSKKEKKKQREGIFYNTKQATLLYNDSDIKVIVPHNEAASCYFGINTRWCTASTESKNYFDKYNKEGNIYIVLIKKENKRYQFHFQDAEFVDEKDNAINPNDLADKYPILWKIFTPIADENKSLKLNAHPSEELQLDIVKDLGYMIRYIKHPSEKVQFAAVKNHLDNIKYIKNPSEKVLKYVKDNR